MTRLFQTAIFIVLIPIPVQSAIAGKCVWLGHHPSAVEVRGIRTFQNAKSTTSQPVTICIVRSGDIVTSGEVQPDGKIVISTDYRGFEAIAVQDYRKNVSATFLRNVTAGSVGDLTPGAKARYVETKVENGKAGSSETIEQSVSTGPRTMLSDCEIGTVAVRKDSTQNSTGLKRNVEYHWSRDLGWPVWIENQILIQGLWTTITMKTMEVRELPDVCQFGLSP